MPQKPKAEQKKIDRKSEGEPTTESSADRSYYYDDSHGYEEYDPEKEEDEDFDD